MQLPSAFQASGPMQHPKHCIRLDLDSTDIVRFILLYNELLATKKGKEDMTFNLKLNTKQIQCVSLILPMGITCPDRSKPTEGDHSCDL